MICMEVGERFLVINNITLVQKGTRSYTSKGISYEDRSSYVSTLRPVVTCHYLCTQCISLSLSLLLLCIYIYIHTNEA